MTDRLDSLKALREKVRAGEWVASGGSDDTWLAIFDAGFQQDHAKIYEAWHGSLDAAKALHDAVLPGWEYTLDAGDGASVENRADISELFSCDASRGDMARCWLIAILSALIAVEEGKA